MGYIMYTYMYISYTLKIMLKINQEIKSSSFFLVPVTRSENGYQIYRVLGFVSKNNIEFYRILGFVSKYGFKFIRVPGTGFESLGYLFNILHIVIN